MGLKKVGVVLAICKDDITRQNVGLRVMYIDVDENNNIPPQVIQRYIKNGVPQTNIIAVKDAYAHQDALWNFAIMQGVTKKGTTFFKLVPKMGVIARYPVINLAKLQPEYQRSFVIIAKTEKEGIKTEYYWVGNEKRERKVKAIFRYFLITSYSGITGLLSEQQVVNLGAKGYILANAILNCNSIQPIRMNSAKLDFFTMQYNFTDAQLQNHRLLEQRIMAGVDINAPTPIDRPMDWIDKIGGVLAHTDKIGCPVEAELLTKTRRLADLLNIPDIRKPLQDKHIITEIDIERLQTLYARMLLWGTLAEEDILFITKIDDRVRLHYLQEINNTSLLFQGATTEEAHREEELWASAYEDMQGTLKDPIIQLYNTKIYDRFDVHLKSIYCDALKAELMVSDKLTRMQNQGILKLDGFDYRIKSPASLAEKVYERSRLENKTPEEAMSTLSDVLRYTVVLPCDDKKDTYTAETKNIAGTSGLGNSYSLCKFANYWGNASNPYRGINTAFRVPNNQTIFEVQFHTQESLDLKMGKMHELYEEQRSPDITNARYAELSREMFALSDSLRVPKDVIGFDMPVENPLY